jgi:predicted Rossmann-fold nucleotide-binding protein
MPALRLTGCPEARQFILFGTAYWEGLLQWLKTTMLAEERISPEGLELLLVTDSPEQVRDVVVTGTEKAGWRRQQEARAQARTKHHLGR